MLCRYGIDPQYKLAIGSKIATELLAKLLDDLRASKEESLATLTDAERATSTHPLADKGLQDLSRKSMPQLATASTAADKNSGSNDQPPADCGSSGTTAAPGVTGSSLPSDPAAAAAFDRSVSAGSALGASAAAAATADGVINSLSGHASGDEAEVEGFAADDEGFYDEPETMHRLCPTYASDINSPLRCGGWQQS